MCACSLLSWECSLSFVMMCNCRVRWLALQQCQLGWVTYPLYHVLDVPAPLLASICFQPGHPTLWCIPCYWAPQWIRALDTSRGCHGLSSIPTAQVGEQECHWTWSLQIWAMGSTQYMKCQLCSPCQVCCCTGNLGYLEVGTYRWLCTLLGETWRQPGTIHSVLGSISCSSGLPFWKSGGFPPRLCHFFWKKWFYHSCWLAVEPKRSFYEVCTQGTWIQEMGNKAVSSETFLCCVLTHNTPDDLGALP